MQVNYYILLFCLFDGKDYVLLLHNFNNRALTIHSSTSINPSLTPTRNYASPQPSAALSTSEASHVLLSHIPTSDPSLFKSDIPTSYRNKSPSSYPSLFEPTETISSTPSKHLTTIPSSTYEESTELVTEAPSKNSPCAMSYVTRSSLIFSILQNVSDANLLSDSLAPQGMAIDWLINKDEAFLCPNATKLIQRYVLALVYYSTNGDNWFKCSGSPLTIDDCGQESPFMNKMRFLSSENECLWAGVSCSETTECVTQIEFGK